jgi:hypothetical protein
MSTNSLIAGAIATFVVLGAIEVFKARRQRSKAPPAGSTPRSTLVRVVELSPTLAIQVFQRPGGSFGYYYLRKSAHDGHWSPPFNMGSGGAFDAADRAEEQGRADAAGET